MWFNRLCSAALLAATVAAAPRAWALSADGGGVAHEHPAANDVHRAADPVHVVATLPVYAEITKEIGGDQVEVKAIADPHEDEHFVRPKPSFAADIRRADLFVTTGLDLELWVPPLLDKAGNAKVSEGGPGYVTAYTGIHLLEVPTAADRAEGDVHIYGNPHLVTDPLNAIQVARNITAGLKRVSPDRAAVWDKGLETFTDKIYRRLFGPALVDMVGGPTLEQLAHSGKLMSFLQNTPYKGQPLINSLGGWLAAAAPFRGKKVICYHKNWAYFQDRFQVTCADYVEPKPGIPPTPGHVVQLIREMKDQHIGVIMAADYFGETKVKTTADRAGARYVMMPMEPGDARTPTYFDVVDHWVNGLAQAFGTAAAADH
ncbi:MAG TPA: metal ABC transporter substrate-binding protein [Gemmatimonadaceae bacterium]|nr:metal ABC transporter substrate-binding protein [Gemmatimonadaceae bacterium]